MPAYSIVDTGTLGQGQGNALIAKLNAATQQINRGNTKAATNELRAFINHVQAYVNAGILSEARGQGLIDAADGVISQPG